MEAVMREVTRHAVARESAEAVRFTYNKLQAVACIACYCAPARMAWATRRALGKKRAIVASNSSSVTGLVKYASQPAQFPRKRSNADALLLSMTTAVSLVVRFDLIRLQ